MRTIKGSRWMVFSLLVGLTFGAQAAISWVEGHGIGQNLTVASQEAMNNVDSECAARGGVVQSKHFAGTTYQFGYYFVLARGMCSN